MRLTILLFVLSSIACAQPKTLPTGVQLAPEVQPPAIVLKNFADEYKDYNGDWSQNGDNYSVRFTGSGQQPVIVYYTKDGKKIMADERIPSNAAPEHIRKDLVRRKVESAQIWQRVDSLRTRYFVPGRKDTLWYSGE